MKTFGKIIGTIITIGIFFFLGALSMGTFGALPFNFIGDKEFANLNEMQQFQQEVVTAVKDAGGTVLSFDLTVQSPPKVHYVLYVPSTRQFIYGKPSMGHVPANIMGLAMFIFCLVAGTTLSYGYFWVNTLLKDKTTS